MCSFGVAKTGRPRLGFSIAFAAASPNRPGNTSEACRAFANDASVSSGFSSSTNSGLGLRGIAGPFSAVRSAQADHMQRAISRCEHHHVQVFTYVAKRLDALFVVVLARIVNELCIASVELLGQLKGQASQFLVPAAFAWVIGHAHPFIVPTTTHFVQHPWPHTATQGTSRATAALRPLKSGWPLALLRRLRLGCLKRVTKHIHRGQIHANQALTPSPRCPQPF
jgi:hypothetical protein